MVYVVSFIPKVTLTIDILPCTGNRNGGEVKNIGSNGNYWSGSLNAENTNNAYELNFNDEKVNVNNNNRNNGYSVRLARVATEFKFHIMQSSFSLLYSQLLSDLYVAYYDARRHKRNKPYQLAFEENLDSNLSELASELYNRTYRARPSTCFLIRDPKIREVFAADFRDRIVHHLYYNYTHEMFERTFIQDSYSCIKGRGTHYGIDRLEQHIRRESLNYTEKCYILKMDIKGYFMQISRKILLDRTLFLLRKMATHRISKVDARCWQNVVDMDFVEYLSREIILLNPVENCIRHGKCSEWSALPDSKSLFCSPEGCGLPIGNLTSQLFSNVYLSVLDDYMKRTLKCRRYGRYVDDFYVVSADKEWLKALIPQVREFLSCELNMTLHEGKTRIADSFYGVEFLGAYLKPFRKYVGNESLRRMRRKLPRLRKVSDPQKMRSTINSYLGIMSHYAAYHVKQHFFESLFCQRCGYFTRWYGKFVLYPNQS